MSTELKGPAEGMRCLQLSVPLLKQSKETITDNFMDIWEYLVTVQIRINSLQAGLFQ